MSRKRGAIHLLRVPLIAALALAVSIAIPSAASAQRAKVLREPPPTWMKSKRIRKRIHRAGIHGVRISKIRRWVRAGLAGRRAKDEPVPEPCPGTEPTRNPPTALGANACEVYPYGCTANFIYHYGTSPFTTLSDGRRYFIGTAGHCVDHSNQRVYMTVGTAQVVTEVGRVYKHLNGGLGNDFAAVRIYKGINVDPATPIGGPEEIYTGCQPQGVEYWGHGYGVAVGQGKTAGGLATNWFDRGYGWTGLALPGDSGSGVLVSQNDEGAGDLTHLIVDSRYPASDVAGTRLTRILTFLGGGFYLVNSDRTYSRATMADTACGNANNGGGQDVLGTLPPKL